MQVPLAITFGGGSNPESGLSGGVITLLIVLALVAVPVVVGLFLRFRDARRDQEEGDGGEPTVEAPPASSVFDGSWGRNGSIFAASTRNDWMMVAALAIAVGVVFLITQL